MPKTLKIGLVFALEEEYSALLRHYQATAAPQSSTPNNLFVIHHLHQLPTFDIPNCEAYVILSGAGEKRAAAATATLLTHVQPDLIINAGLAGAINPDLPACAQTVVTAVVDADYDISAENGNAPGRHTEASDLWLPTDPHLVALAHQADPTLIPVHCVSADQFADADLKTARQKQFPAGDIIEMEAAGILLATMAGAPFTPRIPTLFLKSISDGMAGPAGTDFHQNFTAAADHCATTIDQILRLCAQNPAAIHS